MSDREMHFPPISGYPKQSDTAMSVDAIEAWLDQFPQKRAENKSNGGIIHSVADTSGLDLRKMSPKERKVARAQAQHEHKEALKNLAKQEAQDAKEIAKQLVKWRKEGKPKPTAAELAAKKEARRLKRNELKRIRRMASEKGAVKKEMSSVRVQSVLDKLKADGVFCVADWDMKREYLSCIMHEIKGLGYKVGSIKSGRFVTHYTLDKH